MVVVEGRRRRRGSVKSDKNLSASDYSGQHGFFSEVRSQMLFSLCFHRHTSVKPTVAHVDVHLHPREAAHKSARPSRTRELAKSVLSTSH